MKLIIIFVHIWCKSNPSSTAYGYIETENQNNKNSEILIKAFKENLI